jgi:hypothetical protein
MAIPVKDTPVLTGQDAKNFDEWMKSNSHKKVNKEEYQRIMNAANKFKFVDNTKFSEILN